MNNLLSQPSIPGQDDTNVRPSLAKYRHLIDMGYKVKVDENDKNAVVDIPGPSRDAYDDEGKCKVWSVMRLMGAARYLAYNYPLDDNGQTFVDYMEMTDEIFTFMASSQFEIDKAIYDVHVPKWPLKVTAQLGSGGKTSTSLVSSLVVPTTGLVLATNTNQIIGIDKHTRKATPLIAWWKEKIGEELVGKEPVVAMKLNKPDWAPMCSRRVICSETDDVNKHVNWTSYVIYSIDAMHYGMREGCLKDMTREIFWNGLKTMRLAHFGECFEDDVLSVFFWEDDDQPRTVCFDIQRDGVTVFQNIMTFHDYD